MAAVDTRRQSGLWVQNPDGYYDQAPQQRSNLNRRSFSERAGQQQQQPPPSTNGVQQQRSNSRRVREPQAALHIPRPVADPTSQLANYSSDTPPVDPAHIPPARPSNPSSAQQPRLRLDPTSQREPWSPTSTTSPRQPSSQTHVSEPWSPTSPTSPTSPRTQRPHASASVPERSPLQALEGRLDGIGKESKRARAEEAEYRAAQKGLGRVVLPVEGGVLRTGTLRGAEETGSSAGADRRVVSADAASDDARPLRRDTAGSAYLGKRYYSSGGGGGGYRGFVASDVPDLNSRPESDESGEQKFRKASEALRMETSAPRKGEDGPWRQSSGGVTGTAGSIRRQDGEFVRRESGQRQQQHPAPMLQDERGVRRQDGEPDLSGVQRSSSQRQQHVPFHEERGIRRQDEEPASSGVHHSSSQQQQQQPSPLFRSASGSRKLQKHSAFPRDYVESYGNAARASPDAPATRPDMDGNDAARAAGTNASMDPGPQRSASYRRRLRDAGFAGAAAAATTTAPLAWAEMPKMRGAGRDDAMSTDRDDAEQGHNGRNGMAGAAAIPAWASRPAGTNGGAPTDRDMDTLRQARGEHTMAGTENSSSRAPPQLQQAQRIASEGPNNAGREPQKNTHHHHRFSDLVHGRKQQQQLAPIRPEAPTHRMDEWHGAPACRLTAEDMDLDVGGASTSARKEDAPWRERRDRGATASRAISNQYDGVYEEDAQSFRPQLFLKCGPLLRYTGLRRDGGREIWRGSVMIVTEDATSDPSPPVLRIFAQPADLHQRPRVLQGQVLRPEDEDPVTGQVKVSRTGRPLYVRPAQDLPEAVDLSREENPQGLYSAHRSPVLGPQSSRGPDGRESPYIAFLDKSRIKKRDGEKLNKFREAKAARLHAERGATFWRFDIEVELGSVQHRVAYRINRGPALGFWVPGRNETMNTMFHTCNGFSLSVNSAEFTGPDPLWRDVLNSHQSTPFHVIIGGGDQIYNDAAMRDTVIFREYLQIKNPEHKHHAAFTPEMHDELEAFYLNRYAMWFSQGLFGMANSQIPMVNIWDDHDIIDGYGSYPHSFMSTPVFQGLGAVAFKYYMLFQHQSVPAQPTPHEEPSWILGAKPGPYIHHHSRSLFLQLGRKVAFLGLDCRTERMRDEIMSQASYDAVFDRLRAELVRGETAHLVVLLGVPIAYPRLNFLENILTSRVMDPIKALGRTGLLGGFVNKFDGGVEILDDLDDHWTAKHHKAERNWFVQELQELAAEKSVRVTILGGDVHLAAVGQFYTKKKLQVPKDRDHRYMPNVISSAIVNTPPPNMMGDILNRRNKVHHLDAETDEDMIPMFERDVQGDKRNNVHLLPRRNYCTIREYRPGATPPPSPGPGPGRASLQEPGARAQGWEQNPPLSPEGAEGTQRKFPPGSMKRTRSLTRGGFRPGNLVRRLSGSQGRKPPVSLAPEHARPYSAHDDEGGRRASSLGNGPSQPGGASYFPPASQAQRPSFHRRPTSVSVKAANKAAAKGGADGNLEGREPGQIDLEGGLDIALCMEIDQRSPGGETVPYRLLVPALWYEGDGDANTARFKSKRASIMERFRGRGPRERERDDGFSGSERSDDERSGREGSLTPSPPPSAWQQKPARGQQDTRQAGQGAMVGAAAMRNTDSSAPARSLPYGNDGANDLRDKEYGPAPPASAYPSRATMAPPPSDNTINGNRAPARYPAPVKRSQGNSGGRGHGPNYYNGDEDSLYDSGAYSEDVTPDERGPAMQARRQSKAERFFGIGDENVWGNSGDNKLQGGAPAPAHEEYEDEARRKKGWKIWQRG